MIYDLKKKKIVYSGLVAHGRGKPSTRKRAAFSNNVGSKCSSIGKYHIAEFGKSKKVGYHYRLNGKDHTNSNARKRCILIHTSSTVNLYEEKLRGNNIPLGKTSEGCFTISTRNFNFLREKLSSNKRTMLLWAFDGTHHR